MHLEEKTEWRVELYFNLSMGLVFKEATAQQFF